MHEWIVPLSFVAVLACIALGVLINVNVSLLAKLFIIAPLAVPGIPFGIKGGRLLYAWLNRHIEAVFDGQVIARWEETHSDSESTWVVQHVAVDDGRFGHNFEVTQSDFAGVAVGDAARVCYQTYSGRLVDLVPIARDRAQPTPDASPS